MKIMKRPPLNKNAGEVLGGPPLRIKMLSVFNHDRKKEDTW